MPKRRENINPVWNKKGTAGGGDPRSPETQHSSPTTSPNFENEELERAILEKYQGKNTDASFVIYRLNAWIEVFPEEEEMLDQWYEGLIDFGVDVHSHRRYWLTGPVINRGVQQDPIFICRHDKVSTYHCEIGIPNYPSDHITIRDNDSNYGTFVNGKRISKVRRYPLEDGDIIGLGAPHHSLEEHWGDDKDKRGFVFKVNRLIKSYEEEVDNQTTDGNSGEDDTSLKLLVVNKIAILRRILDFLSHEELKAARLVSTFWKRLADPKIFSRSAVMLHPVPDLDDYTYLSDTSSFLRTMKITTWQIYIVDTEQYYHTDGKPGPMCNYPGEAEDPEEEETRNKSMKILDLLNEYGHLIRDIRLELRYNSEQDTAPIITMVQRTPNLETLQLRLEVCGEVADVGAREVSNSTLTLTLPYVKHFCVGGLSINDNFDWENNVILQIARLCPNIHKVTSTSGARTEHVLRSISRNTFWTTGLNELACEGRWSQNDDQREVYELIHNLPNKLKKLVLHHIPDFGSPLEIVSFENMLRKHSETLEQLVLRFGETLEELLNRFGEPGRKAYKKLEATLKFPAFPKLKILEFLPENQLQKLNFRILFPSSGSGSICYERDFPEIKELRFLKPSNSKGYFDHFNEAAMLEVFIPKETDTVSPTMTWIEFGLTEKTRTGCNEWYNDFVERFRRMFPHVHHPHLIPICEEVTGNSSSEDERSSE